MEDELLIKFLLKEANKEERAVVIDWLNSNPSHQAYFLQFEKIWHAGKNLASKSKVNEQEAWLKFKEKTNTNSAKKTIIKPLKPNLSWLKVAAVFVLITGAWMAYQLFNPKAFIDMTAGNQIRTEKLPDGSEIVLNKNSEISYAADFKNDRSIRLTKGNVFFNVAHDKSRPFTIAVNKITVQVVGTSFNIRSIKGETEVIVETGIVKVQLDKEILELHKGEKVNISREADKLVKEQNNDQLYNYYRSRLFVANNIPLSKLIATLNEAYDVQISIPDPNTANKPIVTTLKESNTLEFNLKNICDAMDLKMSRNQNQIILSKNK